MRPCEDHPGFISRSSDIIASIGRLDSDFAETGRHFHRALRILIKLVALNPHLHPGADPLNAYEIRAMAAVLKSLYGLRKGDELSSEELTFIAFFGRKR
jgi:hypothetical protein